MSGLVKPPFLTGEYKLFGPKDLLIIGSDIRDAEKAIQLQDRMTTTARNSSLGAPRIDVPGVFRAYAHKGTPRRTQCELRHEWEEGGLVECVGSTAAKQLLIIEPRARHMDINTAFILGFAQGNSEIEDVFYLGRIRYATEMPGVTKILEAANVFGWRVPGADMPPLVATVRNLAPTEE